MTTDRQLFASRLLVSVLGLALCLGAAESVWADAVLDRIGARVAARSKAASYNEFVN